MLVNNPDVAERKILRCECNHRNECQLCQRRVDAQTDTEGIIGGTMADRYFNPFQAIDINVPVEFHESCSHGTVREVLTL